VALLGKLAACHRSNECVELAMLGLYDCEDLLGIPRFEYSFCYSFVEWQMLCRWPTITAYDLVLSPKAVGW
jgi:hypothetical protein